MGEGSGLGGLFDKAKKLATDENIDKVAEQVKKVAPEKYDGHVDKAAEEAKKRNDPPAGGADGRTGT
ncbi:hypothetical protein GCM10009809_35180 [Isoptericola hypogeus]|uniref:MT0933-like antitoxin protein n=1 Tax=Isoptericola hypogeus TaxID=300179 RepID=A0ABP4VVN1_9MICO